jgi:hypothetical protein
MLKLIATAFLLASACVEAPDPDSASRPAPELPQPIELEEVTDERPEDDCALTIAEDGICANACDAAAVAAFAEPGTCVSVECELMDGRVIRVGGCRP